MSDTVVLTIKRKWFDMIKAGIKTEEYREPSNWLGQRIFGDKRFILFRNGYRKSSPTLKIKYKAIRFGVGRKEWGAPSHKVVILELGEIVSIKP